MTNALGKLLCLFGWHRWDAHIVIGLADYIKLVTQPEPFAPSRIEFTCVRCGLKEPKKDDR